MANRPMKRCSVLLIREMQIKTTIIPHLAYVRMVIVKKLKTTRVFRMWREGNPRAQLVGRQMGEALWKRH